MKKKVTVAILSLVAVAVILFVIGLLLPKRREFVKQSELKNPPHSVFQLVTDVQKQPSWRSDVREVRIIDDTTWTEIPAKGTPITFRVRRKVENQLFEIEIIEPRSINGYWIGTFEPTETGTKVTFKEVVIIANPLFRLMSAIFVDLDKTMELYMTNLKARLGAQQ